MPRTRGVKYFYKIYCRIYCGRGASCSGTRRVLYFYKVSCTIYCGRDVSCLGLGGLNIFMKFIVEYIVK
jgi:hypothetical protein